MFPKTISPEIFPGIFTKNLSGKRDERTIRDFQKCRIAPFARIPASSPRVMKPILNPSPYQPTPFSPSTQPAIGIILISTE